MGKRMLSVILSLAMAASVLLSAMVIPASADNAVNMMPTSETELTVADTAVGSHALQSGGLTINAEAGYRVTHRPATRYE